MCRPRFSPECVQTALHSGAGGRSREAPPAPPSRAAPSRPSRCNAPPTGETTRGKEGGDAQTSLVATCMLCSGSQRHGTRWGDVTLGRKLRGPRREKGASSRVWGHRSGWPTRETASQCSTGGGGGGEASAVADGVPGPRCPQLLAPCRNLGAPRARDTFWQHPGGQA
ncbi:unnamed protein product [Prorocentrum cordatum]|uniref:Uncharacterized protein n=1 Tax=Prorocentrum cordatum TaxID=2364126 RepID=A0ABN9TZK9_9DINO|nr:unnamed protein product [Polarella glacialis]